MKEKKDLFDISEYKLVILFVVEQMKFPVLEETLLDMCTTDNEWLEYFICKNSIKELAESNLLFNPQNNKKIYAITPEASVGLSEFFHKIPLSLREEITAYIKENRQKYKRKQEYIGDYFKNEDGTYTVLLKITDSVKNLLELRLAVETRHDAKWIYKNWVDKAPQLYTSVHEILME